MMQILGLDTSNYTTSAALLDLEHGTVQQAKQLLPVKAGEAGLRQSDAVFHHTRQLPDMLEQLAPQMAAEELCAIGVSARPRNLEGSYMPCFLAGSSQAQTLARILDVPFYAFSHQQGHIAAALWSAGRMELMHTPHLAWQPCIRQRNWNSAVRRFWRFTSAAERRTPSIANRMRRIFCALRPAEPRWI